MKSRIIPSGEEKPPTGTRMTPAQVAALRTQGLEPSGIPFENGDLFVTSAKSASGTEFSIDPKTGVFTYREGVRGGDGGLNKPPAINVKEGEQLIPDPNSPTGTRITQIPSDAKEKAKADFSSYIQQMTGSYAALNEMGKAVTGGEGSVMSALEATGAGQAVSRALGSEAQVFRDQINMMRPNIVNVIRQSTEMGAKGMDSEKELAFYLSALGDAKLPVEANIKALQTLDKVYGKGGTVEKMLENYPDLKKKVEQYSFRLPEDVKSPIEGSSSNQEIYRKHLGE
jgi:hypothetical protein